MTRFAFADLAWRDVAARLETDCRVVIPLGATEEHGALSLSADSRFVDRLTRAAGERCDVLVAPVIPFGCSAFAVNFPGTISMRTATMSMIVEDVIDCLYRQGFRRLVFVTGHGGNEVITAILSEAALDRPRLATYYVNGWRGMAATVRRVEAELDLPHTEHAAWHEAFEFNVVGPVEKRVYEATSDPDFPQFPLNPRTARLHMADGVQAGLSVHPDPHLYESMFRACVDDLVATLDALPPTPPER